MRFNGDVFVRRGPQTTKATVEDERRLAERNRAGQLPFMLREAWEATSDDLDDVLVARYVERVVGQETRALNHRPLAHQLRALKLVGSTGRPTHLGLLLAGCDPHAILETSYLQFIRHRGTDRTSPIDDQQRLDGPLLTLLERALEVLEAWNGHPIETSAARHVIHPIYPARALREALVNAVVHRDYELPSPIYVRW
ncbi:MAG: hypothetical protein KC549_06185, partial [Myxococcales bacterium]|nr:hypothetical protein [Myxococcales bacterium]